MRNSNLLTTFQNVRKAPDHANCVSKYSKTLWGLFLIKQYKLNFKLMDF